MLINRTRPPSSVAAAPRPPMGWLCIAFCFCSLGLIGVLLTVEFIYSSQALFGATACLSFPVDIVYTWVNGSDPRFLRDLEATLVDKKCETLISSASASPQSEFQLEFCDASEFMLSETTIVSEEDCQNIPSVSVWVGKSAIGKHCIVHQSSNEREDRRLFWTSTASPEVSVEVRSFVLPWTERAERILRKASGLRFHRTHFRGRRFLIISLTSPSDENSDSLGNFKAVLPQFLVNQLPDRPLSTLYLSLPPNVDGAEKRRFRDYGGLKYSLRSLELNAPWIRKVFLVTANQIPSWLNLNHPKLHLISHSDIFVSPSSEPATLPRPPGRFTPGHNWDWAGDDGKHHSSSGYNLFDSGGGEHDHFLSNFNSPAIESMLHNIRGLSDQFIYMNDDIFFGQAVDLSDFWTQRRGQKIFLAQPLPDCEPECPAVRVGDGICDSECNTTSCFHDGGDCLLDLSFLHLKSAFGRQRVRAEHCHDLCLLSWVGDESCDESCFIPECGFDLGDCEKHNLAQHAVVADVNVRLPSGLLAGVEESVVRLLPLNHSLRVDIDTPKVESVFVVGSLVRKSRVEFINTPGKEVSDVHIHVLLHLDTIESIPGDRENLARVTIQRLGNASLSVSFERSIQDTPVSNNRNGQRELLGTFESSLHYSNQVFDAKYGKWKILPVDYSSPDYSMRRVPAHTPHFLNKGILKSMHEKLAIELQATSAHKLRSPNDLQFPFGYYYFLRHEQLPLDVIKDILNAFDLDASGDWDQRELKTFALRKRTTLDYLNMFMISNCNVSYRYPPISLDLINSCEPLRKKMESWIEPRPKYLHEVIYVDEDNERVRNSKRSPILSLVSLENSGNFSHEQALQRVQVALDTVRAFPGKFICVQDDSHDDALFWELMETSLEDFYQAFFPAPSSFELPDGSRNVDSEIMSYRSWKNQQRWESVIVWIVVLVAWIFALHRCRAIWS